MSVRVGVIGAGFVANFHKRAFQSVRGATLAGVYALKGAEELAKKAREDGLGDTKVFDSIEELCREVDVVGVFIPNFARVDTMTKIAEAVRNGAKLQGIVCEKPLGRTIAEAIKMADIAGDCGLKTTYFENQIYMPAVNKTRAQLASVAEKMGPVSLTRSAEEHGGPHEPWFWDPRQQGGGVWSDMGCHSVAVGQWLLTPPNKPIDFLQPVSVSANMGLLKWGRSPWKEKLQQRGINYDETPAEDYVTAVITFRNPETGQMVIAQATDSWMYDAPGLRLQMEAIGPGYSLGVNTLVSPAGIFISDAAAEAIKDAELALEKSQAGRGSLIVVPDEPALYGYVAEWQDALRAFSLGQDGMLNFDYGVQVARLIAAGYKSHEEGRVVRMEEITDDYVPKIFQGRGREVL